LIGRAFYRFGVWFEALDNSYRNALGWALSHRLLVIGGAIIITAASFLLKPMLGSELMPQTDSGDFSATIKMPVGTSVETTNKVMKKIEQIAMSHPDVATVFGAAGTTLSMRGGTTSLSSNEGSITVKLKEERKKSTQDVMADLRKQFSRIPGTRPRLNQFDLVTMLMTGGNQSIEIDIFGDDLTTLSRLSKEVMMRVKDIPGYENVDVNWQEAMPEIQWKVDRNKASQLGISFTDVAQTINTATNGTISSYYQEKGYQYPIIVRMPESERKTVEDMQNLVVTSSSTGGDVLLRQVANPVYGMGPSEITRLNRQRYIAVSGTPQGRSSGEIQADIEKAIAGVQLPEGYRWDWGSNQKRRAQEFGGMGLAVLLAIGLIYMLLASQFESFVHPFTVLLSVPLSATGIILGLFLTNRSFGLTAFIGVLMLVGIVVKNGILLVDYTNVLRSRGIERDKALLMAGPTRLRPILMTASAAALGMLPIAIGLGSGSEIQAPMATAVIGGLITSTALTLYVVPTAYAIIDDFALLLKRKGGAK
jgi:HAE1 family hydrophobic/amphiphilic exporter-1